MRQLDDPAALARGEACDLVYKTIHQKDGKSSERVQRVSTILTEHNLALTDIGLPLEHFEALAAGEDISEEYPINVPRQPKYTSSHVVVSPKGGGGH